MARRLEVAASFGARFCGLMGRKELPSGSALWLEPCPSIHMFFMRFAIDVAFLARPRKGLEGAGRPRPGARAEVLRVVEGVRPWSGTAASPSTGAWWDLWRPRVAALELPAGTAQELSLRAGDILVVLEESPLEAAAQAAVERQGAGGT